MLKCECRTPDFDSSAQVRFCTNYCRDRTDSLTEPFFRISCIILEPRDDLDAFAHVVFG